MVTVLEGSRFHVSIDDRVSEFKSVSEAPDT